MNIDCLTVKSEVPMCHRTEGARKGASCCLRSNLRSALSSLFELKEKVRSRWQAQSSNCDPLKRHNLKLHRIGSEIVIWGRFNIRVDNNTDQSGWTEYPYWWLKWVHGTSYTPHVHHNFVLGSRDLVLKVHTDDFGDLGFSQRFQVG
ncbi:hypothetical protein Hdeb2414_s0010g00337981 [Helianthus debilis subsp. tardiflorus]